jgi:hypothetical protein
MPKPERTCNFGCISSQRGIFTTETRRHGEQQQLFEMQRNGRSHEPFPGFAEAVKARIFTTETRRHGDTKKKNCEYVRCERQVPARGRMAAARRFNGGKERIKNLPRAAGPRGSEAERAKRNKLQDTVCIGPLLHIPTYWCW